jgi:hypothetical protein
MPVHVLPSRGLADLRTLAGRADRKLPSYKAFLRVSFLELERARHDQEIATTRRRLDFMLGRCREIDAEKSVILASADVAPSRSEVAAAPPRAYPNRPGQRGFRFAY